MEEISIFLASSIDKFQQERRKFGVVVQRVNQVVIRRGYYVKLIVCEYLSNEISIRRKQEDYNAQIPTSELFFLLAGKSVGEYTLEELECALKAHEENQKPEIYIFLREEDGTEDESIKKMKAMAEKLGPEHVISFSEFNEVLKEFVVEIGKAFSLEVSSENGRVLIDGVAII